jgi:hypothetical protein
MPERRLLEKEGKKIERGWTAHSNGRRGGNALPGFSFLCPENIAL